ncbi:hypothetical protein M9H77_12751 [Catharanthus roseus]|uniref:Uncharacterized protein n=1 Tax=Catharanthus roseus TaxID=4058 RepID=A0ACC0BIG5_CATRO|nr:hypothetical protein M9H77_12751 [Catharanthus roseus]
MSTDGHLPTQSHQEGTSDPTRMNLNETLRSIEQSIEGLARKKKNQSDARDVEEPKKGKSSATMEQRVGDNLGVDIMEDHKFEVIGPHHLVSEPPSTIKISTQAQGPTPFGEESSNSQHDDPLTLIMQELQSLRDSMRDIRSDVTNLSNQQREVRAMDHSVALGQPSHQHPYFDEELHQPPYGGRIGGFGGRGKPRHFEEVPGPQARHGEPLYDDHEHIIPHQRAYHSPEDEFRRHEACYEDNLYENYGDNPNVGQAYHGGYYDNGMVAYLEEVLKSNLEGFEGQERVPSCSPSVQLARTKQGNKLEENLAKSRKEATPPSTIGLLPPSLNEFKRLQPGCTAHGRSSPIVRGRVLSNLALMSSSPTVGGRGSLLSLVGFCPFFACGSRTYR